MDDIRTHIPNRSARFYGARADSGSLIRAASSLGLANEHAAECLDAFTHSRQTVTEGRVAAHAVVLHFHQKRAVARVETDVAPRGPGVANHIRSRLAQGERQGGFLRRRQLHRRRVDGRFDASGDQGLAHLLDFGAKA